MFQSLKSVSFNKITLFWRLIVPNYFNVRERIIIKKIVCESNKRSVFALRISYGCYKCGFSSIVKQVRFRFISYFVQNLTNYWLYQWSVSLQVSSKKVRLSSIQNLRYLLFTTLFNVVPIDFRLRNSEPLITFHNKFSYFYQGFL